MGGGALALFAAVAAVTLGRMSGALALSAQAVSGCSSSPRVSSDRTIAWVSSSLSM